MWLALAFVGLGFLIGNLVGLSATPILASLIALLRFGDRRAAH